MIVEPLKPGYWYIPELDIVVRKAELKAIEWSSLDHSKPDPLAPKQ